MHSMFRSLLAAIALLTSAALVQASIHTFDANLDGLQETPPNASPATGFGEATLDDASGAFTIITATATYSGLLGPSTAVHLHDAPIGVAGPVILALTLDSPGTATGTFSGSGILTAPQIADVLAGKGYLNVHSTVFPGGEIRGQLIEIPEPSTIVLAGFASLGLLAAARRRRTVRV